jgi:hypothetical protein
MTLTRRRLLAAGPLAASAAALAAAPAPRARIAITLDLEMARNFPRWEDTHWDYDKGNLDAATKDYAVAAAERVAARGGRIHFFLVGRALEQADVTWLERLHAAGHPLGNHTYDHVALLATATTDLQYRFQRAPWLVAGRAPGDVIRENIALTTAALRDRLGVAPAGFRTPGGFADGLRGRDDLQRLLLDLGFTWVSSLYPSHANSTPGTDPTAEVIADIVAAQARAQPFAYPSGLIEVPMSPVSDIGAFRNGRWSLDAFVATTRRCVEQVIADGGVFDFLGHPACLNVVDPGFRTLDAICDAVAAAGDRAELTDLGTIAAAVGRD